MTIADIFDALTAADRPYKRSVSTERAVEILRAEAAEGAIDRDLLETFIWAKVWDLVADEIARSMPALLAPGKADGAGR